MNILWCAILIIGLILIIIKNPALAITSLTNASEKAISLSIKLWAIYALWLGILKLVEETNLSGKISKLLSPIIKFLFGNVNSQTKNLIALNITSNILGLGNASIPSGINAMKNLNTAENYLTTSMLTLLILNSCNLQLIPSTIISLRALHGSTNASVIILPNLLVSIVSLVFGILCVKIYGMLRRKQ